MLLRYLLLIVCLSIPLMSHAQNKVKVAPPADWVKVQDIKTSGSPKAESGLSYRLIDEQYHVSREEVYLHLATHMSSNDIVQSFATVEMVYYPDYQDIVLHHIEVIRDGQVIDKFRASDVEILRQENQKNRGIYDKSNTILIHLSDVKKGDILSYAYTRKGAQPALNGKFYTKCNTQYSVPVENLHIRVVAPDDRLIHHKASFVDTSLKINADAGEVEYKWSGSDLSAIRIENNVPYWHEALPYIEFSEWSTWKEVNDWALSNYQLPPVDNYTASVFSDLTENLSTLDAIDTILTFVQEEVRYLGLEEGEFALKPRQPNQVLRNKYGDCKEKVQVARILLSQLGIPAYPVLVNSLGGYMLDDYLPSHALFDHVILAFEWEEEIYYVDLTIANQRDDALNRALPDYHKGLVVREGMDKLTDIPFRVNNKQRVIDEFTIPIEGPTRFTVTTYYHGASADNIRSYFDNNSIIDISQEYEEYYSRYYPHILITENVFTNDNVKDTSRFFYVKEIYTIDSIWEPSADGKRNMASFYSPLINNLIDKPSGTDRKMPLQLPEPGRYVHQIFIETEGNFPGENTFVNIEKPYLTYSSEIINRISFIKITYVLDIHKSFISPEEFDDFRITAGEILDDLGYHIWDANQAFYSANHSRSVKLWGIFYFVLIIVGLTLLARYIYLRFDPKPQFDEDKAILDISGILYFALISIVIGCIRYGVTIFTLVKELFDGNSGMYVFFEDPTEHFELLLFSHWLPITLVAGLVMSILLMVLFAKQRTSLPHLAMIFYILGFVIELQSAVIIYLYGAVSQAEKMEVIGALSRTFIVAAIWIPFYFYSDQVKQTFTETRYLSESIEPEDEDAIEPDEDNGANLS